MHRAVVPVATMLAIQVMISVSVLSLSVMMPAVARDLAIDPKLVGIFTAIIYGVAALTALAAAGPIVRLGAVRICQAALLMTFLSGVRPSVQCTSRYSTTEKPPARST